MTARVIHSECVDWLRTQPDNSIDAIVTDPPYGLSNHTPKAIRECLAKWLAGETYTHTGGGFMNKAWDAFVPGPEVWSQCLRVLKPGGYALVFAGTRTVDLMGIALRLGGFEIRDSLSWMYGSGFPKSANISALIERQRHDRDEVLQVTAWIRATRDAAGLTNADLDRPFGFAGMAGHWTSAASQPAVPTLDQVPILLRALGDPDVPEGIAALLIDLNGAKGTPGAAWLRRQVVGNSTNGIAGGTGEHAGNGQVYGYAGSFDLTTPSTDDGRRFEPYGTALKPAHEPIIVARKPLDGTHAHNALKWGTGGINVDGCRVTTSETPEQIYNGQTGPIGGAGAYAGTNGTVHATGHNAGRWPPNVVLSHAVGCRQVGTRAVKGDARNGGGVRPSGFADVGSTSGNGVPVAAGHADTDGNERVDVYECVQGCPVGELARQSGQRVSGSAKGYPNGPGGKSDPMHGWGGRRSAEVRPNPCTGHDDTGTAARFFPVFDPPFQYVPKASRAEREAGCEHLDAHTRSDVTGRDEDSAGQNHPRAMSRRQGEIRNTHPTVKPARGLMTWLVRLVTPPNPDAVVLDPFCGSGSTGIACVIERVNFVGVELDEHHVEIARARIAHAITEAGLTAQDIADTTTTDKDVVTPTGPAQVCLF